MQSHIARNARWTGIDSGWTVTLFWWLYAMAGGPKRNGDRVELVLEPRFGSLSRFARQHGISRSTAERAARELEGHGIYRKRRTRNGWVHCLSLDPKVLGMEPAADGAGGVPEVTPEVVVAGGGHASRVTRAHASRVQHPHASPVTHGKSVLKSIQNTTTTGSATVTVTGHSLQEADPATPPGGGGGGGGGGGVAVGVQEAVQAIAGVDPTGDPHGARKAIQAICRPLAGELLESASWSALHGAVTKAMGICYPSTRDPSAMAERLLGEWRVKADPRQKLDNDLRRLGVPEGVRADLLGRVPANELQAVVASIAGDPEVKSPTAILRHRFGLVA